MNISAVVRGSVVVGAAGAILRRGWAIGRGGFTHIRTLTASNSTAHDPAVDAAPIDTALNGSRLLMAWRGGEEALVRGWRGSHARRRLDRLTAELAAVGTTERVRLAGWALGSALLANAVLTRFAAFATPSIALAIWLALAVAALALVGRPDAMAAAWGRRTR